MVAHALGVLSLDHEILVDLVRQRPALGPELLRACAGIELRGVTTELGSIDLSEVAPPEYRTDSVVILRNRRREAVAGVIVEVQLHVDMDKLLTWPVYVAVVTAGLRGDHFHRDHRGPGDHPRGCWRHA